MNFSCDKCQRRYSIADEKVRGKTVKVRCKNCQNVISVEGPPAEMEESTRVVSLADVERLRAQAAEEEASAAAAAAASAAASAPAAQQPWEDDEPTRAAPMREPSAPWFVMVKNQQQGPLEEPVLRELVASGTINARSYFWQQGLADWKRGADIPELAGLFAAPEPPAPPPPPPEPQRRAPEPQRRAAPAPEPEPAWQQPAASEPAWNDGAEASGQSDNAAWAASGQDPGQAPWDDPGPEPKTKQDRGRAAADAQGGAQLGELFSDLDLPGRSEDGALADDGGGLDSRQEPGESEPEPEQTPAPRPAKGKKGKKAAAQREPGENTRVAMVQSGVTRRNPWWKIALVVVVLLGLVGAAAFLLDQLQVVPMSVTTRVNEQGKPVKQSVFSTEGASALRDKLLGKEPPKAPPAPVAPAPTPKPAAADKSPESGAAPTPTEATKPAPGEPPSEELKAVYANGEKQDVGPEVRKDAEVAATDSSEKGGPPPEELEKVMGQVQPAIQSCVEAELKKNPRFKGGKVTLTATVGSSGVVKKVAFDRTDVEGSKVGDCIKTRAKRMVFSSFQGDDVELQIPLVLGTSM